MKQLMLSVMMACFLLLSNLSFSQEHTLPFENKFTVAVSGGNYGVDGGIGVEVGSPAFSKSRFSLRLKANVQWLEQYKTDFDEWVSYNTVGVSWVYNVQVIERTRLFVDLGTFLVIPDSRFSERRSVQGINTSTGVELFLAKKPNPNLSYFVSLGMNYVRAYAEKLEHAPRYNNGFVCTNGFRFYF